MATSSSNTGTIVRLLLIVGAAVILFALVSYYQSTRASERFSTSDVLSGPGPVGANSQSQSAGAPYGGGGAASGPTSSPAAAAPYAPAGPSPIEPIGNESFLPVGMNDPSVGSSFIDPFPADRITPDQLLPKDSANSTWAQANPAGQGDVKDQNFLTAGYMMGFDTVSSSLRNASHDLRSEIPNPRHRTGIWSQSTMAPDLSRRPLE